MRSFTQVVLLITAVTMFLILIFPQLFEKNDEKYFSSLALMSNLNTSVNNTESNVPEMVLNNSSLSLPQSTIFLQTQQPTTATYSALQQSNAKCTHGFGKILLFRSSFDRKSYAPSRDSVTCYAQITGYELLDIDLDNDKFSKTICSEFVDRNFRRHCILAQYLKQSDVKYAVAMDGDVAVVNPNHCIEDYIDSNASMIFYERFHTFEIAACTFIVKNDEYGHEFLMDWARYSSKVPHVPWSNSDNGALLSLLLEKRMVANHERSMCTQIWQNAKQLNDYLRYIHCAYIFLGARRKNHPERIKILRRAHGWGRDGWTSDWRWCDHDFFMHAIKADGYSEDMNDISASSPFLKPFDMTICTFGQAFDNAFHMKPQLKVTCDDLRSRLKKRLIVPQSLSVPYLDDNDLECWPNCDKEK